MLAALREEKKLLATQKVKWLVDKQEKTQVHEAEIEHLKGQKQSLEDDLSELTASCVQLDALAMNDALPLPEVEGGAPGLQRPHLHRCPSSESILSLQRCVSNESASSLSWNNTDDEPS